MTRDFNNQRRNDSRAPFRSASPRNYGQERSTTRTSRPRLNREIVDRAWENGASNSHADYQPRRTNTNGRYSRDDRQNNPYAEYIYLQPDKNTRGRPQRNNNQRPERSERSDFRHRNPTRSSDFQTYNGPRGANTRNAYRSHDEHSHSPQRAAQKPNYQGQGYGKERGYRQPEREKTVRFSAESRPQQHTNARPQFKSRYQAQETPYANNRGRGQFARPDRGQFARPDTAHRGEQYRGRPRMPRHTYRDNAAQYEGDYEYLVSDDTQRSHEHIDRRVNNRNDTRKSQRQNVERHITPMPDGRVLKGSRPAQRKNARFWTDINQDTNSLIPNSYPSQEEFETAELAANDNEASYAPQQRGRGRKQNRPTTSATARNAKVKKPRSMGPKPSKKGFKWPD